MDRLTKEQRRRNMQANKSKGTKLEVLFGKLLWNANIRYRKNDKRVFGKPDFVIWKYKIAIFCDGEYWHGRDWENHKEDFKSNCEFWYSKIEGNIHRDKEVNKNLSDNGWKIFRFWETEIKEKPEECLNEVLKYMDQEKTKNDIYIIESGGGKKFSLKIFGPHSLNEDGTMMSVTEQMALISHYLQNKGNKEVASYKAKAEDLIRDIYCLYDQSICENEAVKEPCVQYSLFSNFFNVPFLPPSKIRFTFIDLFAGMGGFRLAMQKYGGKCVFSSDNNVYAQKTYFANFGELPFGDITKESVKKYIPEKFDILCAGFPCQPFSIAGVSKKRSLGRETGFKDKTQGTLFFQVADIIEKHRPKAFYLENVKNLFSHDHGNTFSVIKSTLEELNYSVYFKVLDGKSFVPQHRERIMIIGFDKKIYKGKEQFDFPILGDSKHCMKDILESNPDKKYTLTDNMWTYLQNYAMRQKAKGNGFGYGLVNLNGISRTLSARYYKDGSEILIPQGKGKNPRRLTPRECARLMGYPDDYIIDVVSDLQAYRQCGNSVIVPLITAVAEEVVKTMLE